MASHCPWHGLNSHTAAHHRPAELRTQNCCACRARWYVSSAVERADKATEGCEGYETMPSVSKGEHEAAT